MTQPAVLYRRQRATATRAQILTVAADIGSAEGLESLSIGRLASELGMSKTGIFAHFGSKQQLQLAVVEAAKQVFLELVVQRALQSPRGIDRLTSMLESWLSYVEKSVFRGGCFFAAASAEFDSRPGPVRDAIVALTTAWVDALREEIAFARSRKEIRLSVDPAQLAFEFHAFVQEANWAFNLLGQRSAFHRARRAIAGRIELISLLPTLGQLRSRDIQPRKKRRTHE